MTRLIDEPLRPRYRHPHALSERSPGGRAPRRPSRAGELAITVISVEEQLSGWYRRLRQAKKPVQLARIYQRLATTVESLAGLPILSFTEPAISRYDGLRALKLNIRKMDLRIAAIALEQGAVLVTRNRGDFERVPGLTIEDWTQ